MLRSSVDIKPFSNLQKVKADPEGRFYYPGVQKRMEVGDILYSSKGLSTFMTGHLGIVGPDYRIYHSHPRGGFADWLPGYISRHHFGNELTVLRPEQGAKAAEWAAAHIKEVKHYIFTPFLKDLRWNYCSKYIWQAFWHSGCGDITRRRLTDKRMTWIHPLEIKYSPVIEQKLEFSLGYKRVASR